jgi:STE24 endopeptidase
LTHSRPARARIPVLVLAAAAWLLCAWLLLRTVVPGSLALPSLDVEAVFGRDVVREARHVERLFRASWALQQVALLATLWVYAKRGPAFSRESAAGPIGTGMLLGMLGLGIVWLVQLPFGVLDLWWARRYDLTETGYLAWAFGDWLTLGAAFASISLALVIVMFLARRLGEWWWLPGAAVFVAIGALFTFATPYLVTGTTPLESPSLRAAAADFEREQGVSGIPVSVEDVSGETSQANAYAVGLGPSRKIVLWNTLLDGRFSDGAVRVVLAHEIAHHSSDHLWKGIGWFALFALPGAWALMRLTRRRGGMGAPAAVPLALLVVAALQLALLPAQNWISRRMEAEADWKALQTTHDPRAARRLFVGFGRTSLGDPDPPVWAHVLLDTHPSLAQRVAMAEAWQARSR